MSPWRMMNEWGVPQVEIYSLLYCYLKKLDDRGEFVPDIAVAGGLTMEDHIYKALALQGSTKVNVLLLSNYQNSPI